MFPIAILDFKKNGFRNYNEIAKIRFPLECTPKYLMKFHEAVDVQYTK